ncbi:MAG: Nif11 family protein [Spirochaetia bacterium]|nr:Nif11 family protein [Spirochaetia bacterium]MBR5017301.1 Nif11 family protein [Spirochaetia bacterium]
MKIDEKNITKEMLEKALDCETADELIALAKAEGFDITKAEAEAYLDEIEDRELDRKDLDKVAGGAVEQLCWNNCPVEDPY